MKTFAHRCRIVLTCRQMNDLPITLLLAMALGGTLVLVGVWLGSRIAVGSIPTPTFPSIGKLFHPGKSEDKPVEYPIVMSARDMERAARETPDEGTPPPGDEQMPNNWREVGDGQEK